MSDTPDLHLTETPEPWEGFEQVPTHLILLWPDHQPPTQTEILSALDGAEIDSELEPDDEEVPWAVAIKVESVDSPVLCWTEPARPLPDEELEALGAQGCDWVIGLQVMLDPEDPLTSYIQIMRVVARAFPGVPAILDVNTTNWMRMPEVAGIFGDEDIEPPAEVLWTIHVVTPDEPEDDDRSTWIHTHGLSRCGRVELEMVEVPAGRAMEASHLLNHVAGLLLESELPDPGGMVAIGLDLNVILQPWQGIVTTMAEGVPGTAEDRIDEHAEARAVVCSPQPQGQYTQLWVWPHDVLDALHDDDTVVYRTVRSTERQAALARRRWDQLATAFASHHRHQNEDSAVDFLVKAGFGKDHDPDGHEHLWFSIVGFVGPDAEGELINEPQQVSGLAKGDRHVITRAQVSDWNVVTPRGVFGPEEVDSMWYVIDEINAQLDAGEDPTQTGTESEDA